ncbi:hypothetical protein AWV80_03500 [Cupriavidus sp. UYMU48A]|nr:hypothetical protein AWV80_03500 [Cupriavidus sp. UYMU48A]
MPAAEQQKAADVLLKILNGSMWELWQLARAQDKQPVVPNSAQSGAFLQQSINALSDSFFYGAPFSCSSTTSRRSRRACSR